MGGGSRGVIGGGVGGGQENYCPLISGTEMSKMLNYYYCLICQVSLLYI